jgi:hypothetical protein
MKFRVLCMGEDQNGNTMALLAKRSGAYGELPQAENTGGAKVGCNTSPKFLEVIDTQLTGVTVGRRAACDGEDSSASDEVSERFLKYARV